MQFSMRHNCVIDCCGGGSAILDVIHTGTLSRGGSNRFCIFGARTTGTLILQTGPCTSSRTSRYLQDQGETTLCLNIDCNRNWNHPNWYMPLWVARADHPLRTLRAVQVLFQTARTQSGKTNVSKILMYISAIGVHSPPRGQFPSLAPSAATSFGWLDPNARRDGPPGWMWKPPLDVRYHCLNSSHESREIRCSAGGHLLVFIPVL